MYQITLYDGTILENLELNGNNYISDTIIDSNIFTDNLATVEIHDGEQSQIYTDMKLVANQLYDNKSWFILAQKTMEDKERERVDKIELENIELKELLADIVEELLII